jgi:TRAP-type C4-dicarboxylate transport system permease small subunit
MLKAFYAALLRVEARLAAALLLAMVALIFLGGAARLAGHPLNWSTDVATAFFAWACFLCADVAWRRDALMAIELLPARLPPGARRALRLVNHLLIAAFLVYVAATGFWLAWVSRARSFQGMPDVSYAWVTLSMPVGALLLLVTTVLKIRTEWRATPREGEGGGVPAC